MAAFFRPQFYTHTEPNFQGLFRLIDDFDKYSALANGNCHRQTTRTVTFTPKFDLKETETGYELHGELPGVDKENIHIEFTDPQTLVVRGKVERTYTAGTPPAGVVENKPAEEEPAAIAAPAPEESGEDEPVIVDHASHHATVEDDPEESGSTTSATEVQATPATTVAEVAKPEEPQQQPQKPKQAAPKHRYYLVERNIGQFARSFYFPSRVDNETVKASLNNGILTVTVDKAKKHESRRIAIF